LAHFVESVKTFALSLGGPGLAILAFLDSSFLSFPEINDLLIITYVIQHPAGWWSYAAFTTVGSLAGCLALYGLGRKGGEAFLKRRFSASSLERGLAMYKRWGLLAIIVPSILPPPTPFKIFVLLAGVARVPTTTFLGAVTIGRGIRYFGEALLAYYYGEAAKRFVIENMAQVGMVLAAILVLGAIVYVVWRRRRRQPE
jgi:membrane protein YqaA with SNARE-associated domain